MVPNTDILWLILQYLKECEVLKETAHTFEKESGIFFDLRHFLECGRKGEWEEAEKYLSGFTAVGDNQYSSDAYLQLRMNKYYEALGREDYARAREILTKELQVFDKDDVNKITLYFGDRKFRLETVRLHRRKVLKKLKKLIVNNPLLENKLQSPSISGARLVKLLHQSGYWQHRNCKDPSHLGGLSFYVDHICGDANVPARDAASGKKRPRRPHINEPEIINLTANTALKRSKSSHHHVENKANQSLGKDKKRSDDMEEREVWRPLKISVPSELHCLRLQDPQSTAKIMKLIYTNAGDAVVTLAGNATLQWWKWPNDEHNIEGKASAVVAPTLLKPPIGSSMINEIEGANPEECIPCLVISKNDNYVLSASGGEVSLFVLGIKRRTAILRLPPSPTALAFHPQDSNIVAIALSNFTAEIYDIRSREEKVTLRGHKTKVTGLAFSPRLHVLVTCGAGNQLCVWSTKDWKPQAGKSRVIPAGLDPEAETRVQFHTDQTHLLVVDDTHIAVFESPKLERFKQWTPDPFTGIKDATYSCDGQTIFVCCKDGALAVLMAETLTVRCLIESVAYLPPNLSTRVHPLSVAAHPSFPNQFAVGLSDGAVLVLEPLEKDGTWGVNSPLETGTVGSQPSR